MREVEVMALFDVLSRAVKRRPYQMIHVEEVRM